MKPNPYRRITAATLALFTGTVTAVVVGTSAAAAPAEGQILGTGVPTAISDSYIVVFEDSAVPQSRVDATARDLAGRHRGTLGRVYRHALRGMEVRLTETQAKRLAANPSIKYVEQNAAVSKTGTLPNPPSWGLDRVDQRNLPLDSSYTYPGTASNVRIYVLDSGIRTSHDAFGGRAIWGTNVIDSNNTDCDADGHGTHVAGIAGGWPYGVAPGAQLTAVKVLDCSGNGTIADGVEGMDWVAGDHDPGELAVANVSLASNYYSLSLDIAADRLIDEGVTVVAAASNDNGDACAHSPASAPRAITVGATDGNDARRTDSNFGSCLDLFAPGDAIKSASNGSDWGTRTQGGTSMAAPHVAGAAALVLSANPSFTPQQVRDRLVNDATNNVVTNGGAGSPNRLLFVKSVAVPDVHGQSALAASATLTAAGLGVVQESAVDKSCNYTDLVMTQTPAAGTRVSPGSSVTIKIGTKPSGTRCP
ncbi:S8 family serine peptidase [Streptomyces sp. NPDC056470]|uniref:S8 family peptidase n=1 Tax=Streptomyces sp. NPDC056470 TaxID=3345831 RepID=UPI0036B5F23E